MSGGGGKSKGEDLGAKMKDNVAEEPVAVEAIVVSAGLVSR